ncbi:TPA: hypothetical protein ACGA04_001602 [Pseudomonas aeruginosa]
MPGDLCACGYETDPAAGYACSECDGSGEGCVGEVCRECDGSGWFVTPEQARAALAQPSPAPTMRAAIDVANDRFEVPVAKWGTDLAGEEERPEVVAWRYGFSGGIVSDKACLDEWKSGGEYQSLMTVAQHERIVKAWIERWKAYIEFSAKIAAQRDAALARVAGLEHSQSFQRDIDYSVLSEYAYKHRLHFNNLCAVVRSALIALPAQAQHSVPEGLRELLEMLVVSDLRKMRYAGAWRREVHNRASSILALLAAAPGNSVPQAWLDVQAERRRQVEAEGWTPQHDDEHADGQMAQAAGCYALHAGGIGTDWPDGRQNGSALFWPWDKDWWKPTTPRRDLVKACALALAEIERLDRVAASQGGPSDA